jgi:hypothetical protein
MTGQPSRRWLTALLLVMVMAGLTPVAATGQSGTDSPSAWDPLEAAALSASGGSAAIGLTTTLVGLLDEAIQAADDGPWIPATDPYGMPLNLVPALPVAKATRSPAYADGCHAKLAVRVARVCHYGDTSADFTVLVMGDSHGAMWLPALEAIALRRGWSIEFVTKSSCPPADISVIRDGQVYGACDAWRASALRLVRKLRPDLAILTSDTGYELAGLGLKVTGRYRSAWRDAWTATLQTVGRSAGHVVVLNDVPKATRDPVRCLARHMDDIRVCETARDQAIQPGLTKALRRAAHATGATFVDPSVLVCPEDPCPVVDGRTLIAYDTSHLTPVYARQLSARLEALLPGTGP